MSSFRREDAARDMAHTAIGLHRVVPAVEVIEHADAPVAGIPGVGVAEVPASAIVAHDQLRPPGFAAVLADRGADARGHEGVDGDRADRPTRHTTHATRD